MKTLNEKAKEIHELNRQWWEDLTTGKRIERNRGQLLMLVITEFAEAVEGIRKGLMDDKLPHRKMEEVEMADAYIRLMDYAGGFGLELWDGGGNWGPEIVQDKAETVLRMCHIITCIYYADLGAEGMMVSGALRSIEVYCQHHSLDLSGAVEEKLAYNKSREDHTHAHRISAGGKKF